MKGMHILEVAETSGAGVGRHVRGLCEGLIALGHQVTVAYSPYRLDEAFRQFMVDQQNKIDFVPLECRREVSPKSDLTSLVQLLRLVKRKGPFDVIHGHSSKGGAIARIAGRWSRVPTVYTPHSLIMSSPEISGAKAATYTLIERILGNWATSKMIAVSKDEREFILKLKLISNKRLALINNGVDDRDFEYLSERMFAQEIVTERPLTFGSIMRFSPQKAPGHLVEAFVRLRAAMPQIPMRLVIAGDGELFAQVERQVQECGLGEEISLLGWRTDTRKVLLDFDVFVLSSLYEGGSYTILDAMAAALPTVSTDVFGTKETIGQVPGNVIVPAGDPAALARGMERMATVALRASSRKSLAEIGQANHGYIRSRFTQSETTRRTFEVYQELHQISW
jgi:glycosyltransferase involved in cell wall biosynthesis